MEKFVSVIIPCRNEGKFIADCLNSLVNQDFPKENLEVLIVDGESQDNTKKTVREYSSKFPFIKLLNNPKKITPAALNIGIKESQGDLIVRMDAHARYQEDYISKSVRYKDEYNADNVGGVIETIPASDSVVAQAIAVCLSHFFGAGSSYFRIGAKNPKWVDTVFGGCYDRKLFDKIGMFNENLVRTQDLEFNLRLKRNGGKILLVPEIKSFYYPKSNLKDFFVHNVKDGMWSILPLKFVKIPLGIRHYIPLIFVLTLPLSIWPYIPVSLYFSLKIAFQEKKGGLFFVLPLVFATRHIGYGLGSLWGLIKLILND